MTFEEARAELKEISCDRYRNLAYQLTEKEGEIEDVRCQVYVDPHRIATGKTWREALDAMIVLLDPEKAVPVDMTEAPE